jgi:hypothetical protein
MVTDLVRQWQASPPAGPLGVSSAGGPGGAAAAGGFCRHDACCALSPAPPVPAPPAAAPRAAG